MKTDFSKFRTIALLAVLPLVATAAASAQQWMVDNTPLSGDGTAMVSTVKVSATGRMHTVALNRSGAVEGRVAAIDRTSKDFQGLGNLKVYFVQDGQVAQQTTTSLDGSFVVTGLAEGAYTFVATGDSGFVAYGVKVVAEGTANGSNVMEAAAVSPNLALIKELLGQQLPKQIAQEILAANESFTGRMIGANRVVLDGNKLKGRLTALIGGVESTKGTVVHLFRDGQEVAEVVADEAGNFTVEGLEPGVYEFVASGSAGFAAISFEAVDPALVDTDEMAVALQEGVDSGYLDVSLAAQMDSGFVSDSFAYGGGDFSPMVGGMDCVGNSFGCGGAVGGSCGGCGGGGAGGGGLGGGRGLFGRGGGLGRLLLLGAAVAIPLAISNPGDASPNGA